MRIRDGRERPIGLDANQPDPRSFIAAFKPAPSAATTG